MIQRLGLALNLALRLSILYFLAEVMLNRNDPRFAGKAIPIRNLVIVLTFSSLVPVLHRLGIRRWTRYPVWLDDLYLSIFWLDMAGNSFNLYDTHYHFDLIPHFHGTGALSIALRGLGVPGLAALLASNTIHALLEAQEILTDVFFGTHNVRGVSDTVHDLIAGALGTASYGLLAELRPRIARELRTAHRTATR